MLVIEVQFRITWAKGRRGEGAQGAKGRRISGVVLDELRAKVIADIASVSIQFEKMF